MMVASVPTEERDAASVQQTEPSLPSHRRETSTPATRLRPSWQDGTENKNVMPRHFTIYTDHSMEIQCIT